MQRFMQRVGVAGTTLLMSLGAFAQTTPTIDTSGAVATIGLGIVAVGALGGALLAVTALKKIWGKIGGR